MNLEGEIDMTIHNNESVISLFSFTTIVLIIGALIFIIYKLYENRHYLGEHLHRIVWRTKMAANEIEINKNADGVQSIHVKYI
jgi:hypothetical protein